MRDPHRRQLAASRAAWQSAMHIVGTPSRIVVRVAVIVASVCSASKRCTTATAAPARNVETRPVDWPSTCENGAAPSTTSSGREAIASAALRAAARIPPWVRTAPFGRPVVPEVKRITAGSSSSRSTTSGVRPAADGKLLVDDRARRRRREPLLDLRRREQHVERDDDRAEPQRAEVRGDERGRVRQPERDAVAGADAPLASAAAAAGSPVELRVRDAAPSTQRAGRSGLRRGVCEDAGEVHCATIAGLAAARARERCPPAFHIPRLSGNLIAPTRGGAAWGCWTARPRS